MRTRCVRMCGAAARRLAGAALVLAVACGGDSTTEPKQPGIRAVAGTGASDTVLTAPGRTLVVEVRGAGGALATGAVVRFEARPAADSARRFETPLYVCPVAAPSCGPGLGSAFYGQLGAVDTTRGDGRARVTVRAGTVAGPTYVTVTVPELGVRDSVLFTVAPGAPRAARFAERAAAVVVGATRALRASVVDAYNNARPDAVAYALTTPAGVATLDAAKGTVTGIDVGSGYAVARFGGVVDSVPLAVVPAGRLLVWGGNPAVVAAVNTDGTGVRVLAPADGTSNGVYPRYAPNGALVVALAYGGAVIVDSAGASRRQVATPPGVTGFAAARLMADGSVLVVGQQGAPESVPVGAPLPTALYRIAPDGSAAKLVDLPNAVGFPGKTDIAPDGSRVAYVTSGAPGLVVVTVASGATSVIDRSGGSPRFSPSGDRVAYLVSPDVTSGGSLAVAAVDGTGRTAFGSTVYAPGLAWSPDGAYVLGRSGETLRAVRPRDGAAVALTLPGAGLGGAQPDWR